MAMWSRSTSPASGPCATGSCGKASNVARYSAAHYFLEGLVDLGVEYIFANLSTDHVSLIEELARWDQQGCKHPEDLEGENSPKDLWRALWVTARSFLVRLSPASSPPAR